MNLSTFDQEKKIWGFGRKKEMTTTTKANPINHGTI
jgi:hypothetical protein